MSRMSNCLFYNLPSYMKVKTDLGMIIFSDCKRCKNIVDLFCTSLSRRAALSRPANLHFKWVLNSEGYYGYYLGYVCTCVFFFTQQLYHTSPQTTLISYTSKINVSTWGQIMNMFRQCCIYVCTTNILFGFAAVAL